MDTTVEQKQRTVRSTRAIPEEEQSSDDLESTPSTEPLDLDRKFELLKNQRRRRVLRYLKEKEDGATTGELAEHVAALENGTDVKSLTSKERKAAYVGLYQCHLPKMDQYGVIEFEQARGRVRLAEAASELDEYLERDVEPSWWPRYLGIAGVGGSLYVVTLAVNAVTVAAVIGLITLVAVSGCAVAQWRVEQADDENES